MPFTVKSCKRCPAFERIDLEKMIGRNTGYCNKLEKTVLWDAIDELCPFLPENEGKEKRATVRR